MGFIINPYAFGVAFTGLLDTYSGAAAAYSVRKLRSAYSGNCIRVRRSNDNAEQNIGFDSNGNLDESALTTFVGSNNGYVTTWYDQSGNGNNVSQSSATYQPRIVNAGTIERNGSVAAIRFGMSNATPLFGGDILKVGSNSFCTYVVGKTTNIGGTPQMFYSKSLAGPASSRYALYNATFINHLVLSSTNTDESIVGNTISFAHNLYSSEYIANTNFKIYRNGVNEATKTPVTTIGTSTFEFQIGAYNNYSGGQGYGSELIGNAQEMIFYLSNQSSNRTGIESNINTYYSIY